MRARIALWAALAMLFGCGAKSALDKPPPAPCEDDGQPPPIAACDEWSVGPEVVLDDRRDVLRLGASAHAGGVAVAYLAHPHAWNAAELWLAELDPQGRPRAAPWRFGHAPTMTDPTGPPMIWGAATMEPRAVGGCEIHALGRIWVSNLEWRRDWPRRNALAIRDRDGSTRTMELDADEEVWDVRRDGDELSWLSTVLYEDAEGRRGGPLSVVRAARRGQELARITLQSLPGGYSGGNLRRQVLREGGFVLALTASEGVLGAGYDDEGALTFEVPLGEGCLGAASSAVRDDGLWLVWSEGDDCGASGFASAPDALRFARVEVGGEIDAHGAFELEALRPIDAFELAWIGGSYLVPLMDGDAAFVGIFDADGRQRDRLPLGPKVGDAEVIATPEGAVVVAARATGPLETGPLVAYPLRCSDRAP